MASSWIVEPVDILEECHLCLPYIAKPVPVEALQAEEECVWSPAFCPPGKTFTEFTLSREYRVTTHSHSIMNEVVFSFNINAPQLAAYNFTVTKPDKTNPQASWKSSNDIETLITRPGLGDQAGLMGGICLASLRIWMRHMSL